MSDLQMTRRRFAGLAAVGAATLGAGLAGCSSGGAASSAEEEGASSSKEQMEASASSSMEEPAAASSAPEEPMEEEEMARPVILVTSFGTSFPESRHITIGAIESAIRESFPDYDVRRAFTAQIIIDHIEEDTGRHIDNFEEAMERAIADGVKEIVIQPTHLTAGAEYSDVKESLANYQDKFEKCALGEPLLTSDDDYKAVADAVIAAMEEYDVDDTAVVLMGHGNEASPSDAYDKFQTVLADAGKANYIVCTVEQTPGFKEAVTAVQDGGYSKAALRPLMVVAGDHANNDMAGAEGDPESLALMLEAAGIKVTSVVEGLGQIDEIDDLYVKHTQAAIDSL